MDHPNELVKNLTFEIFNKLDSIRSHVSNESKSDIKVQLSRLNLVNEELEDVLLNWEYSDSDINLDLDDLD